MKKKMKDLINDQEAFGRPLVLNIDTTLEEAHSMVLKSGQKSIPVTDKNGKICAIFDKEQISEALLEERQQELSQLHHYIHGYSILGLGSNYQI